MAEKKTDQVSLDTQHTEALERHAAREAEKDRKRKLHEIEGLALIEKYETELGPKDEQFKMIDLGSIGEGFVVVKLGEAVLQKKLEASVAALKKDAVLPESALDQYVSFCVVHPPIDKFRLLCARRPNVLGRAANALSALFGVQREQDEGKF